jgi:outer membrane protein
MRFRAPMWGRLRARRKACACRPGRGAREGAIRSGTAPVRTKRRFPAALGAALLAALAPASPALAQISEGGELDDDIISRAEASDGWNGLRAVGFGGGGIREVYAALGNDPQYFAFPMFAYRKDRLSFQGKQIAWRVNERPEPYEFEVLLDYRFQGYQSDNSPVLAGMENRDGTLEAGAKLTWHFGNLELSGQTRWDVMDRHGGHDVVFRADYEWRAFIGTWLLPYAGLSYRSQEMADYYYGVRPEEVATLDIPALGGAFERSAYEVGETLNPFLGMQLRQGLSRNLVVVGFVHHHFMPEAIVDSPIVGREGNTAAGVIFMKPFL